MISITHPEVKKKKAIARYLSALIKQSLLVYGLPASESAVRLLVMIAAHESMSFRYVQQLYGPALGLFQMEPPTHRSVCIYIKRKRPEFKKLAIPKPEKMVVDTRYAAAMARIYLMQFEEALPHVDDIEGLAEYAKKYWNTKAGKATAQDYFKAYKGLIS